MAAVIGRTRDRRQDPRTPTKVTGYVTRRGLPRYHGQVRDLSATGAFVDTGPLPILEQRVVELDMVLHMGAVARVHHRTAVVVRRSREGVALKFF